MKNGNRESEKRKTESRLKIGAPERRALREELAAGLNRRNFIKRGALFVPGFFIPRLIRAQSVLTANGLAGFIPPATAPGGGGGGGTYSLIDHNTASASATGTATTPALNTTGASLLIVGISWFSGTPTVSDSKGNSWTGLTSFKDSVSNILFSRFYHCISPSSVGGGHTFSVTSTSVGYCVINVAAFALSSGTPAFDTQNGTSPNETSVSSMTGGSVTPAGSNELFLAMVTWHTVGVTVSINSSFAITNQKDEGEGISGALAYKIQTTGGAENPTWTPTTSQTIWSAANAVFK